MRNKVNFNLKSPSDEESLIYLIFRYHGKKFKRSTGIIIQSQHWNSNKQRITQVAGHHHYPSYNLELEKQERTLYEAYDFFRFNKDEVPSIPQLRRKFEELLLDQEATMENFIRYAENLKNKKLELREIKQSTAYSYDQMISTISKYPNSSQLEIKDITENLMKRLTLFMEDKLDYSPGQINKVQRRITTVVRSATAEGYNADPSFFNGSWKVKGKSYSEKSIALTLDQINAIRETSLSDFYDGVRDVFLLGIYTGQRISDFDKLNQDNLIEKGKKKYLEIIQQKTNKVVYIPINSQIQSILNKYNGYPPQFIHQKFNDYIKEIAKKTGLNEKIRHKIYSAQGNIKRIDSYPIHKIISAHDCRRTFATLAHQKGIPLGSIMKITGHSSIQSLSQYLRINPMEAADELLEKDIFG